MVANEKPKPEASQFSSCISCSLTSVVLYYFSYNSIGQDPLNSGGSNYTEVLTSDSNNKKLDRTSQSVLLYPLNFNK